MKPQQLTVNDRIVWNDGKTEHDVIVVHNDPDTMTLDVIDTVERVRRSIDYAHVGFFGTVEQYLRHELEQERAKLDWLLAHCQSHHAMGEEATPFIIRTRQHLAYVMTRQTVAPGIS